MGVTREQAIEQAAKQAVIADQRRQRRGESLGTPLAWDGAEVQDCCYQEVSSLQQQLQELGCAVAVGLSDCTVSGPACSIVWGPGVSDWVKDWAVEQLAAGSTPKRGGCGAEGLESDLMSLGVRHLGVRQMEGDWMRLDAYRFPSALGASTLAGGALAGGTLESSAGLHFWVISPQDQPLSLFAQKLLALQARLITQGLQSLVQAQRDRDRVKMLEQVIHKVEHQLRTPLALMQIHSDTLGFMLEASGQHEAHSVSQPVSQLASQPVSQLASQPASQPASHQATAQFEPQPAPQQPQANPKANPKANPEANPEGLRAKVQVLCDLTTEMQTSLKRLTQCGLAASLQRHREDLREILLKVLGELHPWVEEKQIRLNLDLEPCILAIDRWQIQQVFQNLLTNALAFSPEQSLLSCRCRCFRQEVLVQIEDEGPGLSSEDLERLFSPFYSRRPGGTGLGLSIAQKIVLDHQGSLWANNLPQRGAQFSLVLPRGS